MTYHGRHWLFAILLGLCITLSCAIAAPLPFAPIPITGQNGIESVSDFDKRFVQLLRRWQIPGGAIAIMRNNKFVLTRGYGWADLETREPVQPDSLFRVASVSKAITAVAILKLVQQHKLHLDDKVFDILGQLEPLQNTKPSPQIRQITVQHLLHMSSGWGITSSGADPMFGPWTGKMVQLLDDNIPPDCPTAARMMMSLPLQFAPGKSYSYSNINYCMLGLIISKVTGQQGNLGYESYIRRQLFEPMGVYNMRIGDTSAQGRLANEVKYYRYGNGYPDNSHLSGLPYSNTDILKKNSADGGWIGPATDLVKFVHAVGTERILSSNMLNKMTAKPPFYKKAGKYFAMGWTVKQSHGHRYWMKTGSFTGTTALVMHRDDGTSYAALFNTKPGEKTRFIAELQNLLFSKHPTPLARRHILK